MNEADDPGWGYALRALIPIWGLRYSAQRAPDGLSALRSIFVGLVAALPLFGVAFSFLDLETASSGAAPLAVVLVGLLSIWGIRLLHRRPLATMSLGSLAASWRTRFFIGVGIAEIPPLVAIAVTFAGVALWIYLVGLMFSLLGFFWIAPSRRNLAGDQDAIRSTGSPLDLTEALMTAGPQTPGPPPRPDS